MMQDFAQGVHDIAKGVVNNIHTALPGKIVSYDPGRNLARIQPVGKFVTMDSKVLDYPLLTDVPLSFPYSQRAEVGVTFPVEPGDSCIIIVSEVELDQWRSGAESNVPLKFNLTSAMAVPSLILGGATMAKACSRSAVVITSGSTEIVVNKSSVDITGDVNINGNVSIQGNQKTSGNMEISGTGKIGGVIFNSHTHSGVHGETSGPH